MIDHGSVRGGEGAALDGIASAGGDGIDNDPLLLFAVRTSIDGGDATRRCDGHATISAGQADEYG